MTKPTTIDFCSVTPERWPEFARLFGKRGACGGCWCMWWRLKRSEFERRKGDSNKRAMKRIIDNGRVPGILALADGEPIGWCSVAPRDEFPALERSRILKPVDDLPVWTIVCLFVASRYRNMGVSHQLLKAAVSYARNSGASIVEGYPFDLTGRKSPLPGAFVWTGLVSAYRKAGFKEIARRSPTRPIMRCYLKGKRRKTKKAATNV